MVATFAQNWWTFTLRGVFALLFGVLAFVAPGATLTTLIFVFGFYAILNGVFAFSAAWNLRRYERWWVFLLEGLLGIAAGVIAFVTPGATALAFLSIIAAWAILVGILQIAPGDRERMVHGSERTGLRGFRNSPRRLAAVWAGDDQLDHRLLCDRFWGHAAAPRLSPAKFEQNHSPNCPDLNMLCTTRRPVRSCLRDRWVKKEKSVCFR
jgi:hypothetical protein